MPPRQSGDGWFWQSRAPTEIRLPTSARSGGACRQSCWSWFPCASHHGRDARDPPGKGPLARLVHPAHCKAGAPGTGVRGGGTAEHHRNAAGRSEINFSATPRCPQSGSPVRARDAAAVAGHPYMLQLVGERRWRGSGGSEKATAVNQAERAAAEAGEPPEAGPPVNRTLAAPVNRQRLVARTLSP